MYSTPPDQENLPTPSPSPELQARLTLQHWTMLTHASGIAEAVIAERGYRSVDGAEGYAELKALGFSKAQAWNTTGLLLPLWTTDGHQPLMIYRPDQPAPDATGHLRKYLLPKGSSVRLDCPPRCHPRLADPHLPVWLTEGQKKAMPWPAMTRSPWIC